MSNIKLNHREAISAIALLKATIDTVSDFEGDGGIAWMKQRAKCREGCKRAFDTLNGYVKDSICTEVILEKAANDDLKPIKMGRQSNA